MKFKYSGAITAIAAAIALLLSGCTGQQISQTEETDETPSSVITTTTVSTVKTTALTTRRSTSPELTSGTTVTTIPTNENIVENLMAGMTIQDKIYQLFIVTPESLTHYNGVVTEAGSMTKQAIETTPVGGIIYFSQNIEGWHQTHQMISKTQTYAKTAHKIGLFIAVDEEGGDVARVSEKLGVYKSYDMDYYGTLKDYEEVYDLGSTIGTNLSDLGFNLNLAPVADVAISRNNELGDRIFSDDPQVVADMTAQFVKGLESTGVSATLKHFPGLGAENGNTHDGSVVIDRTIGELWESEFVAFRGGMIAEADFVMVGHQITTASEDNLPGCLSPVVVDGWLKTDMGYDGLVITDSQSMGAITDKYTPGQAAVLALQAGVDMILMPYDLNNAVAGVKSAIASGELTEEQINTHVRKILTKKLNMGLLNVELPSTSTTTNK